jgi:hypothetical protein
MSVNTQGYYQCRARIARDLAAAATDPEIAAIHNEMADRYDLLAVDAAVRPTLHLISGGKDHQPASD